MRQSDHVQRHPQQLCDKREAERDVGLALGGTLAWAYEREIVRNDGILRLRHGTQTGRTPNALVIALAEQPREPGGRARPLAADPEPGHQVEPVQREGNVLDVALSVRV